VKTRVRTGSNMAAQSQDDASRDKETSPQAASAGVVDATMEAEKSAKKKHLVCRLRYGTAVSTLSSY
jgi:hypothetical protein